MAPLPDPDVVPRRAGLARDVPREGVRGPPRRWGRSLAQAVVELGFVAEDARLAVVAAVAGVAYVALRDVSVPPDVLRRLPARIIRARRVLPLEVVGTERHGTLFVATVDPFDLLAVDELASAAGMAVRPVLAAERALDEAIARHLDRAP